MTELAELTPKDGRTTEGETSTGGASRRTLLRAAGLVALTGGGAAALASCSNDLTETPSTSVSPVTPEKTPTETPSVPGASTPTPSTSAATGPSVASSEVPVGGGYIMPDSDYVVTQPEAGTFKAFSKICTHAGCPVSEIADKKIVCKCHGSVFSIEDGSVQKGPAKAPLAEAKATVSGDKIVVTA